ncbi:hypothetical protein C9426_35585 [Serratia sp. S1B]|nr:hypothetical protein C9426_35585 [Serratia sp. S1B]
MITPTQFSDTYLVPLSDITVIAKEKQIVKFHIKNSTIDRTCALIFSNRWIQEANYQTILADILAKLARKA